MKVKPMTTADPYPTYRGHDELFLMATMYNYNAALLRLLTSFAPPPIRQTSNNESPLRFADIGAGLGCYCAPLRVIYGNTIIAVEPDAVQREALLAQNFPVCKYAEDLPAASCDFIYALNVIEHIENDRAELAVWASKLKPNGRLFVYAPAFTCLYSEFDRKIGHYRRYRRRDLRALLLSAGLKVETSAYADALGFFAALAYKLMNRRGNCGTTSLKFYDRFGVPISEKLDGVCSRFFGKNVYAVARKV